MKSRFIGALFALATFACASTAHAAYALFLTPHAATAAVGDEIVIDLNIVDNSSLLSAFQLSLGYDPAVTTPIDIRFAGTLLDGTDFPSNAAAALGGGVLDLFAFSVAGLGDPSPSGVLASIVFSADAEGSAVFALRNAALGFNLPDPDSTAFPDIGDAITSVRVTANRIPEPGSLGLVGLALVLAGATAGRVRGRRSR